MKRIFFLTILSTAIFLSGCDNGTTNSDTFQQMYGGTRSQWGNSIQQTSDGGYIVAGTSWSDNINGATNHGYFDYYVIKLDSGGSVVWQNMYGGSEWDEATSIQQTTDGGYIIAGHSKSKNIAGVTTYDGKDIYIIKLDSEGSVVWQNMHGGYNTDAATSVQQTNDGGYIIAGYSNTVDISGVTNHGSDDMYVIKLGSNGGVVWRNMYGGPENDYAHSIRQTNDGGYIAAGYTSSHAIGESSNAPAKCYVVKLDSGGAVIWQNTYGGSGWNEATSIRQTSDGGYILGGHSSSTDISGITNRGGLDCYLIKLDSGGTVEWQNLYGGSDSDYAYSVRQTSDGGYVLAGSSYSTDISGVTNHGDSDYYITKVSGSGALVWEKMYGGSRTKYYWHYLSVPLPMLYYACEAGFDIAYDISQTNDGGYIVAGSSTSADISGVTRHSVQKYSDVYVLKLDENGDL